MLNPVQIHQLLRNSLVVKANRTLSGVLITWVSYLNIMLRSFPIWATKKNQSSKIYPRGLNSSMRILEEFLPSQKVSVPCPKPNRYTLKRILTKSHSTCNNLICITPNCCLSFVSHLYPRKHQHKIGLRRMNAFKPSVLPMYGFMLGDL